MATQPFFQQKFPKLTEVQQEIMHSLTTAAIFASMSFGVYFLRKMGFGSLYFEISDYGWAYYFFTIVFVILLHDTYFYWTHRLMHHPKLFKIFHKVHHQSHNPTPFSSLLRFLCLYILQHFYFSQFGQCFSMLWDTQVMNYSQAVLQNIPFLNG
jgi:sterol desaturase/sphingolipid hydroxylase (fatty acid hydroxylase superfamily)